MSESVKSLPPQYQAAVLPFMVSLMDVPYRREVVQAIRDAGSKESPEQIEKRIQQAVSDALAKSGADLKARELDMKYNPEKIAADIDKVVSEVVKNNVASAFAAMQAGEKIALVPQIAPIADVVMQKSGWRQPSPGGQDPNYPQPQGVQVPVGAYGGIPGDTSPLTPQSPESPVTGANIGMETLRAD